MANDLKIYLSPALQAKLAIQSFETALKKLDEAHNRSPMAAEYYLADMRAASDEFQRVITKGAHRKPTLSNPEQGASV